MSQMETLLSLDVPFFERVDFFKGSVFSQVQGPGLGPVFSRCHHLRGLRVIISAQFSLSTLYLRNINEWKKKTIIFTSLMIQTYFTNI